MLCSNCTKLLSVGGNKNCIRCQNTVYYNTHVLCDACSSNEKQCAICLKKVVDYKINRNKGCRCGA